VQSLYINFGTASLFGFLLSCESKTGRIRRVKRYSETVRDNLSKAGWSWGCVATIDSNGRTLWIADAHCDDGKRFIVRADETLTAFLELESAIRRSTTF
jgi:hypothetical protein